MSKVAVILPAAGNSTRFGGLQKKPYVLLEGRPVWQRTAELFWNRSDVSRVYLVIHPDDRDDFKRRYAHLIAFANIELVEGGAERFESVANALAKIPADVDLVAVHDAVRPLTPPNLIDVVFAAAKAAGAAMLAIPVADTLKRVEDGTNRIIETVSRQGLWQAQTPQVFRRDWLAEAYGRRQALGVEITDDAQLIEARGHAVQVVRGAPINFKITTEDDLDLAAAFLAARANKPAAAPMGRFDEEAKW